MINYKKVIENDFELNLYISKVEEIEKYLETFGKSTFWEIVKNVGGSERRLLRLLDEMTKEKIIKYDNKNLCFYLKNKNGKHKNYKCPYCDGSTILLGELSKYKKNLKKIWESKPKPTLLFDQRPVTMDTSLKRCAYLLSKNDVYNKKIIFLGDDDLTSICLAMINKNCEITVIDADQRLIDYINKVAQQNNFRIKAYVVNVMDNIPNKLKGKYDVLMTDPTPEKIPFIVFTNFAIDLLKENGILYTSIYSSAMEKKIELQKVITNMNLFITEMIPNFTNYQSIYELYRKSDIELFNNYGITLDEQSICFTETLFRLEKTNKTKKIPIKYNGHEMMGKATKRVVNNKDNEVAEESEYLNNVRNNIIEQEKTFFEG